MAVDFWKIRKGISLRSIPSDPSSPENGDVWYNSTLGKFRKRENGVTKNLDDSGSDVHGPGSSVANSVAIFSDTSGQSLDDTSIIVTGGEDLSGINDLDMDGDLDVGGTLTIGGSAVVTVDDIQTLTNKTIDGDVNTIQDLALTSLKTNLTDASKFLVRDASGIVISNTKAVPAGVVVGTTDAQVLTSKTIDGDDNTVQDLALGSLKTVLGDANKFVVRNGSGAVISSNTVPAGTVVGTTDSQALTNKTIDADSNTITNIENADIKAGAAIDAAKIHDGSVSNTEFGYLDGVTSAIQTQLNNKLNLSGGTLTNFLTLHADPTNALHAATKQYVDGLTNGLDWKNSAKAASTANLTLSGEQTVDGIALVNGDRALVKNQTAPEENGLYVVAVGAWSRSLDMDSWLEVPGAAVFVEQGTVSADKGYVCTSNSGGTLGTTAITWVQFSSASSYVAGNGIDISGQTISVAHDGEGLTFSGSNLALELDGSTLSKSASGVKVADGGITNTQVNASAAIAYSKLNLVGSILNADINASAAIAYSKLALSNSILNADINASAAIAYSKLNLSGSIVNADVSASAAIAYSKLALTNSILNADINASAAIAYSKLSLTNSILNADINASAAIAYSKLNLTGGIVNADVNASAAIAYSKLSLTNSILNADINSAAAIAGTKISPDFGAQNVTTTGNITTGNQLLLANGSVSTLALAFTAQTTMGLYRVGADHLRYKGVDDTIFSIYNEGVNDASILQLTNNGSSTGDQYIYMLEGGVTASQWALGRDDSDSGSFKLSQASSPGTNDFLVVSTAGAVTLGASAGSQTHVVNGYQITFANSRAGGNMRLVVNNNQAADTASGSELFLGSEAGSGDTFITYSLDGSTNWVSGVDNSDSDSYKISNSAALGTTDRLKITTSGAFELTTGNVFAGTSQASAVLMSINNSSSDPAADAILRPSVVSGGGDAAVFYENSGGSSWISGIDNSDSDSYKISLGNALGTSNFFKITTGGVFTIGPALEVQIDSDELSYVKSASGSTLFTSVQNNSNTASSNAALFASVGGTSAGDPFTRYSISGGQSWATGLDNSASDAYKISSSTALGTSDKLSIDTSGNWTVTDAASFEINSPTSGSSLFSFQQNGAGNASIIRCYNYDTTNGSSNATFRAQTGGASSGDPSYNLIIDGATTWHIGADNSDSDALSIGTSATVGSSQRLKISTAGAFTIGASGGTENHIVNGVLLDLQAAASGSQVQIIADNTSNTASSISFLHARVGGSSAGDPYSLYTVDAVQSWSTGLDNSDSDAYVIAASTAPGTNNRLRISTAGDVSVSVGDLSISTAGKGLKVAEGSNAKMGVSTLVAGTVVVSTTAVTATSRIFLTGQNSSGTHGELTVSARTAATSFTITSTSALDTRDVAWMLVEPA